MEETTLKKKPRAPKVAVPKQVAQGDVLGGTTPATAKARTVKEKVIAKTQHQSTVLSDVIERSKDKLMGAMEYLQNYSLQEQKEILQTLQNTLHEKPPKLHPDEELLSNWREVEYPYKNLMSRKNYEKQKYDLQVELLKLQN